MARLRFTWRGRSLGVDAHQSLMDRHRGNMAVLQTRCSGMQRARAAVSLSRTPKCKVRFAAYAATSILHCLFRKPLVRNVCARAGLTWFRLPCVRCISQKALARNNNCRTKTLGEDPSRRATACWCWCCRISRSSVMGGQCALNTGEVLSLGDTNYLVTTLT